MNGAAVNGNKMRKHKVSVLYSIAKVVFKLQANLVWIQFNLESDFPKCFLAGLTGCCSKNVGAKAFFTACRVWCHLIATQGGFSPDKYPGARLSTHALISEWVTFSVQGVLVSTAFVCSIVMQLHYSNSGILGYIGSHEGQSQSKTHSTKCEMKLHPEAG